MRFDVQNTKLCDPVLLQEVQEFADQCYSRAYFRLKNSNGQLSDATINSVGWIGSSYFLNTSGYYDYYTAMTPRSQWSYNSSRDSGYPDIRLYPVNSNVSPYPTDIMTAPLPTVVVST